MKTNTPFAFELYASRSLNYLERLVDIHGQPYFNVFWTEPVEAAHDWPDCGDVTSRQLQGAILLRRMTGRKVKNEDVWLRRILALIDSADGLLHRPAATYSQPVADWGDAALTLYALATATVERNDARLEITVRKMAEGMLKRLKSDEYPDTWLGCFAVKSLMVSTRYLGCEAALEAARILIERYLLQGSTFTSDNTFGFSGHMHGNLRAMGGAADYALTIGEPELYSRMEALYRYVKTTGTRFGFLPEAIGRQSDIIACETCALMDFAAIGVTLANHGHPEYWGDMERLARNHLVESQVRDVSWLSANSHVPDTDQFTWRDIASRIEGAWAGWSSPNHILACRETLNAHWGGPELRNKTRVLQNCCGGSGVVGLYILWKNSARYDADTLTVNMHLDKKLPQAEIRCLQPYQGRLSISLQEDCSVRVRIPEFSQAREMRVRVNEMDIFAPRADALPHREEPVRAFGNFLELGWHQAGDQIEVIYPLPEKIEEVFIGNLGFRQWHYQVTWKGDTVVCLQPVGNEVHRVYSDYDKTEVPVYYGEAGPGSLYQREAMLDDLPLAQAPLHSDDGALNFWKI